MRCPRCHQTTGILRIRHSELDGANLLQPIDRAVLECGCELPLAELPDAQFDAAWEAKARRRRDDQLRSIFE